MKRLLLTGAAGGIGRAIRPRLAALAEVVRVSDLRAPANPGFGEEAIGCDLADKDGVLDLVKDCDGIIHLGGVSTEDSFDRIVPANIVGLHNLYEAARAHGRPRILFASSNHATGFHAQDQHLDATAQLRPDSLYGVSKCFGEALARMYFDKLGQETAIVRIGSCFERPTDLRMLSTWLSYDDLVSLISCVFRAPHLGCPIIWGVSNNDASWWDNRLAAHVGWRPRSNAEMFRPELEKTGSPVPSVRLQGGSYPAAPIPDV